MVALIVICRKPWLQESVVSYTHFILYSCSRLTPPSPGSAPQLRPALQTMPLNRLCLFFASSYMICRVAPYTTPDLLAFRSWPLSLPLHGTQAVSWRMSSSVFYYCNKTIEARYLTQSRDLSDNSSVKALCCVLMRPSTPQ